MPRIATTYLSAVIIVALAMLLALPWDGLAQLSQRDILGVAVFAAIGVLSEAMAIDFRIGHGRQSKASIAFLPFLSAAVIFPPVVAALAAVLVIGVAQFALRRHDILRGLFNCAQGAVSVGLAAQLYTMLIDPSGTLSPVDRSTVSWLPFFFLAATFFMLNISLNAVAIAAVRGQSIGYVFQQITGPRGSNMLYDVLASPLALVPATLYATHFVLGILIIALPLLLIRTSYLSKLQLLEANQDLLKVLVKAIETRDPYTSGHSVRVATLAYLIGRDLDLNASQLDRLERAALLHDIGKIDAVFATVIQKPSELSNSERALIEAHAAAGADLLESLSSVPQEVIQAVRHHHERFDGTGYPAGLRAGAIPLFSRIIMLCDSIDAMLSDRPYRRALSIEQVKAEIDRCSGTQFDPDIVSVVIKSGTLDKAAGLVGRRYTSDTAVRPAVAVV
jgi:putative nucleotidyltransferase with HDIG domain